MTVSSIRPVNNHWGNGSTTVFDFDFLIENQDELVVTHATADGIRTNLVYGVDYSIHEIGNKNGSYIVFPLENSSFDVLKENEFLSLALYLEIKQESQFPNSANLELEVLEWTFDYVIRLIQMLRCELDRTLKVDEGSDSTPQEILTSLNETQKNTRIYADGAKTNYEKSVEQANKAKQNADIATNKAKEAVIKVDSTLSKTQITNCILEIPERIKYTLTDGVLTLKAGSELVFPVGFESDGVTRKFNYIKTTQDYSFAYGGAVENLVICITASGGFYSTILPYVYAGSTTPTFESNRLIWYDTANNYIRTSTGSWMGELSFPLFMVDIDASAKVSNIKNVFNGFGFIGNTTFVLPDVKALLPNGRNADGTLNNLEVSSTKVSIVDETTRSSLICFFDGTNITTFGVNNYFEQENAPTGFGNSAKWLNTRENIMYTTSNGGITWNSSRQCYLGILTKAEKITEFKPNKAIELVKRVDLDKVSNSFNDFKNKNKAYVTETYSSGSSGYRVWSNGQIEQWGISSSINGGSSLTIELLKAYSENNYNVQITCLGQYTATGQAHSVVTSKDLNSFTLTSGNVSNSQFMWCAIGN